MFQPDSRHPSDAGQKLWLNEMRNKIPYTYAHPVAKNDGDIYLCWYKHFEHRIDLTTAEDRTHVFASDFELSIWLAAQAYFEARKFRRRYLDVGCGGGRIISKFGGIFKQVACLDADAERLSLAKSYYRPFGLTAETLFVNERFLNLDEEGKFDAISCIHVIQHIPEFEVSNWLAKMHSLLARGGVVVLATTH